MGAARLGSASNMRRAHRVGWSDAYGHMLVATGRVELMLDPGDKHLGLADRFPALLRESGGYFGDWAGNETVYAEEALSTDADVAARGLGAAKRLRPKRPEKRPLFHFQRGRHDNGTDPRFRDIHGAVRADEQVRRGVRAVLRIERDP